MAEKRLTNEDKQVLGARGRVLRASGLSNGAVAISLDISISSARRFMELPPPEAVKKKPKPKPRPKPTPYRKPESVSGEGVVATPSERQPTLPDPSPSGAIGTPSIQPPADEPVFEDDVNEKTFRQILCRVQEIAIPKELIDVRVRSGGFVAFAKRIRMRMAKERIELSYDSARKFTIQFMADLGVKP